MISLKKILLFFICFVISVKSAYAVLPIKVETKILGKEVVFIFYHDKDQVIDLSVEKNKVKAVVNVPSEFKIIDSVEFKTYASSFNVAPDRQRATFNVLPDLEYQNIINGENLYAIKFRSSKNKEEDLSVISSAKNDPGAIKYYKDSNDHVLSFNIGNNNSKVSVFFKGKYVWIVFDQKKVFSFKEGGIFSKFELVPSEKGTVLRMMVDQKFDHARIEKIQSGWDIRVSDKENQKEAKKKSLLPKDLVDNEGVIINGNFAGNEFITFQDPELGHFIAAMPVKDSENRITSQRDALEFSILKSTQGIAVVLLSDDVKLEKYDDSIKIVSNIILPQELVIERHEFPTNTSISDLLKLPSILPYLDKNLDILDFNQQKGRLIAEAASAKDNTEAFMRNLDLAKFYFIHGWYNEALDALNLAKQYSYKDYQYSLEARFLAAVTNTILGQHSDAQEEYNDLLLYDDLKKIPEINVWNKYNEFALGINPGNIGIIDIMSKTIHLYSDDKYWSLVFAEIEIALSENDLKFLDKIFKEVRATDESKYTNSLKYYKADYYRKKDQINLAKQYYRDLTDQDSDLFNKTRAEFELVKFRVENKEIGINDGIDILERLRFMWRGDQLEYQILLKLASYYKESKDILGALRTFNYIQSAFNNKISNFYVTSEMAKIFNDVFLPGGAGEEMDDFTAVALFYEFKELNPIGEQGDNIILSIVKKLVKLDLLDNATELLRHQVTYRLQGEKKVINADNLAVILMMSKKPREAILVLDETDKDNFNFSEHEHRVRLRARALMLLEKYDEVLEYLKDDNTEDAEIIRREALFQGRYWKRYIDDVSDNIEDLISNMSSNPAITQDILRLAISYYMLNVDDKLVALSNYIGDKNINLKNTVDLLISSSGSVDYRNLDNSLNVDQMKILLDKYKSQFLLE